MLTIAIAVVTYLMEIYDHGTDNFLVWGKKNPFPDATEQTDASEHAPDAPNLTRAHSHLDACPTRIHRVSKYAILTRVNRKCGWDVGGSCAGRYLC